MTPGLGQSVYKTPTGKKYHLSTCRMVENTSAKISFDHAKELGLEPCKICKPDPQKALLSSARNSNGEKKTSTQCKGLTKGGTRCKHLTRIGNGYCFQHQPK
jgi:hypothetical protein